MYTNERFGIRVKLDILDSVKYGIERRADYRPHPVTSKTAITEYEVVIFWYDTEVVRDSELTKCQDTIMSGGTMIKIKDTMIGVNHIVAMDTVCESLRKY